MPSIFPIGCIEKRELYKKACLPCNVVHGVKAGPLRLKHLTNALKIRILSQTSMLYLIRYASVIPTVRFHL